MYAMQYRIPLPADYDMQIIRERVRTKGHVTDDYPGLAFKAYLASFRGLDGAEVNEYAPFYLWHNTDDMAGFLWRGGGFFAVAESFGRPPVEHSTVAAWVRPEDQASEPRFAIVHREGLTGPSDPRPMIEAAVDLVESQRMVPGVHSALLAVDPRSWDLIRFSLWHSIDEAPEPGDRYSVLHYSQPANLRDGESPREHSIAVESGGV